MAEPVFEPNKKSIHKPPSAEPAPPAMDQPQHPLADLHRQVGNRAVQRLIQQGAGTPAELDDETAGRINAQRGGGQELDPQTRATMSAALGYDFGGVQVHASSESDELSAALGAEAFTTGSDIFFSEGSYDPDTSEGRQLLAHELTHVVQQGTGQTGGGSGPMTVNEPGDAHEQQADSVAAAVSAAPVQRHTGQEEALAMDPAVQRQEEEEEETLSSSQEEGEEMGSLGTEEEELSYVMPEEGGPMSSIPEEEEMPASAETEEEEELSYVMPEEGEMMSSVEQEEEEEAY